MSFQSRLASLIGHEIIVVQVHEPVNEDGSYGMSPGRCREVGNGFMVVETTAEEDGGDVEMPAEFVINTSLVSRIIHMTPECSGCLMASVNNQGAGQHAGD